MPTAGAQMPQPRVHVANPRRNGLLRTILPLWFAMAIGSIGTQYVVPNLGVPSAVLHGLYSLSPSWEAVQTDNPLHDNERADTAAQRLSAAFAKLSQEDQQDALAAVEALRRTTTSAAVEPAMDKVQETSDKDEQARETVESPVQPLPSAELVETVESNQLAASIDAPTQAQASLAGDVVETTCGRRR